MSRILEFQPADEQTVVARVLLELHQAIDTHFPDVKGSSRQFTKTVLSSRGEATAVDQRPDAQGAGSSGASDQAGQQQDRGRDRDKAASKRKDLKPGDEVLSHTNRRGEFENLEFSKADSAIAAMSATTFEEAPWSKRLTKLLVFSLVVGLILLAWIYLFGAPKF